MFKINGKTMCNMCFSYTDDNATICPVCGSVSNLKKHPDSLPEGTILAGKYTVGAALGKGGFGITYLCYDLVNNHKVAIKEYMPSTIVHRNTGDTVVSAYSSDNEENFKIGLNKFYDEARLVSKFNGNPNIISVYEFFHENNTVYFVMEYLDGCDFKHYIAQKGGKISENEAIYVLNKVTDALLIVHSTGILHRDISPDNIFISNDGNIKLIDFGAARQVIGEASKSLSVILKQGFAPLEQYQRKGNQGPWTDIYALGATIYYALTGNIPDDAMSRLDDSSLKLSGISAELTYVIEKMLAVKIDNRFKDAFEVKRALESVKTKPVPLMSDAPENTDNTENQISVSNSESTYATPEQTFETHIPEIQDAPVQPELKPTEFTDIPKSIEDSLNDPEKTPDNPNTKFFTRKKIVLFSVAGAATFLILLFIILMISGSSGSSGPHYDTKTEWSDGYYLIESDGKYGILDNSENIIVPCEYDNITEHTNGYALLQKSGLFAIADINKGIVSDCNYEVIDFGTTDNRIVVKQNGLFGLLNESLENTVPCTFEKFEDITGEYNGKTFSYIKAWNANGIFGLYKANGEAIAECKYVKLDEIDKNGFAKIYSSGVGLLSFRGDDVRLIIPAEYSDIDKFYKDEGIIRVKNDNGYGFYNQNGEQLTPCKYDFNLDFSHGYCTLRIDGKWGIINSKGEEVIECVLNYDIIYSTYHDHINAFMVETLDGKYGYLDTNCNEIVPAIYDKSFFFSGSSTYAVVVRDGLWGVVDAAGHEVVPCTLASEEEAKAQMGALKENS